MFTCRRWLPRHNAFLAMASGVLLLIGGSIAVVAAQEGAPFKPVGQDATPEDISAWDIDIEPDGTGLPPGSGTVARGAEVYEVKCSRCHGATATEVPGDTQLVRRIPDYWCCATTLYDYINRSMPFYAPQSLEPEEVYSVVALLLYWNEIVPEDFVADATTVPTVEMPRASAYTVNPWTSLLISHQPGDPWSHDKP